MTSGYDILRTDANNAFQLQIYNYASSTAYKPVETFGIYLNNDSQVEAANFAGGFKDNTAITSLVFSNSGGNHSAGTVLLYGVK